jgi:UDP-N-acetylmuramate dehydrogenase
MQLKNLQKYGGQWFESASLTDWTWLKLKNTQTQFMWFPETAIQISSFIKDKPHDYFVLGNGSNTILGNLDKVLIMTRGLNQISFAANQVIVGSGFVNRKLVLAALSEQLGGFEFIYTIPGTIGGTVCMNGGAHRGEIGEHVDWVEVVRKSDGALMTLTRESLEFSYRYSNLPDDYIVTSIALRVCPVLSTEARRQIHDYQGYINKTQPRAFTLGSTFKNPEPHRAWELLSRLSEEELTSDNFYFSKLHRNFLINSGEGTMKEALYIINRVQNLVTDRYGITLELELKWCGD